MVILRSAIFSVVFYVFLALMMVVGLPVLLLSHRARMVFVRCWARGALALLAVVGGIKVEYRNLHLLPKGASILAVKHQSFLETFALIAVVDDFTFILKKELIAIPFFGWYLRGTRQIAIDREKRGGALPLLQEAVTEQLAANRQIIIFPEGTRRPVGAPPAYKAGVAALCAKRQVPCTPVALNTGLFWPRQSRKRRPGTVVIEFLPPILPGLDKRGFMAALQEAIEPATNALVAQAIATDPQLEEFVQNDDAARPSKTETRHTVDSIPRVRLGAG